MLIRYYKSLSQDVYMSLLKHFCQKIVPTEDFFRQKTAHLKCWHCYDIGFSLARRLFSVLNHKHSIMFKPAMIGRFNPNKI